MKDCTGQYKYKGFYIRFVELRSATKHNIIRRWILESESESELDYVTFNTIKEAKIYIDKVTL